MLLNKLNLSFVNDNKMFWNTEPSLTKEKIPAELHFPKVMRLFLIISKFEVIVSKFELHPSIIFKQKKLLAIVSFCNNEATFSTKTTTTTTTTLTTVFHHTTLFRIDYFSYKIL